MRLLLTKGSATWDMSRLMTTATWSGDKASISRQLAAGISCTDGPVPEIGDTLSMEEGDTAIFEGIVLRRELASEQSVMSVTAFDRGYYLHRNDGTYKFTGTAPEAITRRVCEDRGIPIVQLPTTGLKLSRKFASVALNSILTTAWSLAREQTKAEYAIRYTPAGLLVTERSISTQSLVLQTGSNLMDAKTVEDASKVVNSVAIYDQNGNFLRRTGDQESQQLLGIMEGHLVQGKDGAASANEAAEKALQSGQKARTVTVNVLGDVRQIAGETVVAREPRTGLTGVFWIDADAHTWKNNGHYARLDLNCRNVMTTATAGSELK